MNKLINNIVNFAEVTLNLLLTIFKVWYYKDFLAQEFTINYLTCNLINSNNIILI